MAQGLLLAPTKWNLKVNALSPCCLGILENDTRSTACTTVSETISKIVRSSLKAICTVNADEVSCGLDTLSNSAVSASASLSPSARVPYSALVFTRTLWAPVLDPMPGIWILVDAGVAGPHQVLRQRPKSAGPAGRPRQRFSKEHLVKSRQPATQARLVLVDQLPTLAPAKRSSCSALRVTSNGHKTLVRTGVARWIADSLA